MIDEEQYIIEQFKKNIVNHYFSIAIYGIGKNTKLILDTFPEAPVVGLMDATCKESVLFGKKILSDDEVAGKVDVILVVARKAVQEIIYPRIEKYKNLGVQIINIEGEEIGKKEEYVESDIPEYGVDLEDIKRQIDSHEYISFDLFDTLIMRRFLMPSDVFESAIRKVDLSQKKKFELIKCREKIEKEEKALKDIDYIYCELALKCGLDEKQREDLKQAEFEIEKDNLIIRKDSISLLEYAREKGKKIYVLSDMYYTKGDLKTLCRHVGLELDDSEIISSCDINASKENGEAFLYLINLAEENKNDILHIGDNLLNDYQNAKIAGIDAIHILSSYEILLNSSLANLLSDTTSYEKRCLLGLLISKNFNSPFALNKTKGKVVIDDFEELGYFLGAIFYCFSCWMINEAEKEKIEQLILPGRDGYLIKKVLDFFKPKFHYIYVCASRRAYELASISGKKDIIHIQNKASDFKGSKEEFYRTRFNIELKNNKSDQEIEEDILKEASYQKDCLINYFSKVGISNNCITGVFDCVASGTVHSYLEKLLKNKIYGFYFGIMSPQKEGLTIKSAFGTVSNYHMDSDVLKHYLLIEDSLSEMSGTFIGFREERMIFEDNVPNEKLVDIQNGILYFVREASSLSHNKLIDLGYCNEIMQIVFSTNIEVSEAVKNIFTYDDSYLGENDCVRIWQ